MRHLTKLHVFFNNSSKSIFKTLTENVVCIHASILPLPLWVEVTVHQQLYEASALIILMCLQSIGFHNGFAALCLFGCVFWGVNNITEWFYCFFYYLFSLCAVFTFFKWGCKTSIKIPGIFQKYLMIPFKYRALLCASQNHPMIHLQRGTKLRKSIKSSSST